MKTVAIIAAGGVGARLDVAGGKQLLAIAGKPVAAWAVQAVADARGVDEVIVACDPKRVAVYEEQLRAAVTTDKVLRFVGGGATRSASIAAALEHVAAEAELILIHDGARPLVTPELVDAALDALQAAGEEIVGVIVGHPVSDTLKRVTKGPVPLVTIAETIPREELWQVQTPQVFRAAPLRGAYAQAARTGRSATDDAGLLEEAGSQLALLTGPRDNLKVTVPEDRGLIEALLRARTREEEMRGL
ncbi:MAG: 2-C-methyl-D-erythritol 4-phosphate cytidylyltransferase [Actinomycetia bacterium]|nr:2-C-methyl-D-erythritol 4-phosphate cytidylyltransferase [Actinomycetes bacterium]